MDEWQLFDEGKLRDQVPVAVRIVHGDTHAVSRKPRPTPPKRPGPSTRQRRRRSDPGLPPPVSRDTCLGSFAPHPLRPLTGREIIVVTIVIDSKKRGDLADSGGPELGKTKDAARHDRHVICRLTRLTHRARMSNEDLNSDEGLFVVNADDNALPTAVLVTRTRLASRSGRGTHYITRMYEQTSSLLFPLSPLFQVNYVKITMIEDEHSSKRMQKKKANKNQSQSGRPLLTLRHRRLGSSPPLLLLRILLIRFASPTRFQTLKKELLHKAPKSHPISSAGELGWPALTNNGREEGTREEENNKVCLHAVYNERNTADGNKRFSIYDSLSTYLKQNIAASLKDADRNGYMHNSD
ncbi:hypothetical protein L249_1455, partial [Ophiocordyceps polyrhachis-furcata BCC 54312]